MIKDGPNGHILLQCLVIESRLATAEQELHVLWRQLFHSDLIIIDSAVYHVCFLLLQHDHTRLD